MIANDTDTNDDFDPLLARRRARKAKSRQRITLAVLAGGATLAVLFAVVVFAMTRGGRDKAKEERGGASERVAAPGWFGPSTHQELAAHLQQKGVAVSLTPGVDLGGTPVAFFCEKKWPNHPYIEVYLCADQRAAKEKAGVSSDGFAWGRFAFVPDGMEDMAYLSRIKSALR